jgi:hypothetical protein
MFVPIIVVVVSPADYLKTGAAVVNTCISPDGTIFAGFG